MSTLDELLASYTSLAKGQEMDMENDPIYGTLFPEPSASRVGSGVKAAAGKFGSGYMASPEEAKAMLPKMALNRGYGRDDVKYLNWIIQGHGGVPGESGFNIHADNPTSSAIGIPQRLQSVHGNVSKHWMNNAKPQLDWFLDYIGNRYEDPQDAWAHKVNSAGHWY